MSTIISQGLKIEEDDSPRAIKVVPEYLYWGLSGMEVFWAKLDITYGRFDTTNAKHMWGSYRYLYEGVAYYV